MGSDLKVATDSPPTTEPAPLTHQERADYRPSGLDECLGRIQAYFDTFAPARDRWRERNYGYHLEVERNYRYYVPKDSSVLEIGCGTGDLLAALLPSRGMGIDLSPKMIETAKLRHPHLRFEASALEKFVPTGETFDYIVLSDVIGFTYDILKFFEALKPFCHARTRIVLNVHSRLWQPLLSLAERLGMKYRQPVLNWVTTEDVTNLLRLAGFDIIQTDSRILLPKRIPLLSAFCNRILAAFWPFKEFCVTNWIVARLPMVPVTPSNPAPARRADDLPSGLSVSVICPCRNEAGNIPAIVKRLPKFGSQCELIFVEGNSKDETYEACLKAKADNPEMDISVYKQTGRGKKDAVWLGFEKAKGDLLMILDADLSVPPEDLPAFYNVIASGSAEFVNGSRLVYPMENKAMRFLNLLGNKFFSMAFSYLIGQHVKDTLCGTKVLLRTDYQRLQAGRAYFGDFDPFGDFDLLFGAAKLGLKIVDMPIRYRERVYGETQISRFKHGWMLLKMCGLGLLRLKMRC
jgi:ubiquinone/menaquinone biosynthesis C-methylase UbiE